MRQCYCDACTRYGKHIGGSPQYRSAYSVHQKAQNVRDLLRQSSASPLETVQQATLPGAPQPHLTTDDGPSSGTYIPLRPPGFRLIESPSTPKSRHSDTMSVIETRIQAFRLPPTLSFSFPPLAPTSMYPGEGGDVSWEQGPSGLRSDVPANADILLHVAFLQTHLAQIEERPRPDNDSSEPVRALRNLLRSELGRMERLRRDEWGRQQYLLADAAAPGRGQSSSSPIYCNTGNYQPTCRTVIDRSSCNSHSPRYQHSLPSRC